MPSLNKVMLIGNLGRAPEVRYTQGGTAVAKLSLATTEKVGKEKKEEKTEWHNLVAWGRLAEICGEYLDKGSTIYIEGKLQTKQWEDKEGVKRQTKEIVIFTMQMLGGKRKEGGSSSGHEGASSIPEDDIPF